MIEGNLYVGTSAAEILHFVSLPGDSTDGSSDAQFILASRLEPSPQSSSTAHQALKGVQQVVLLPRVNRACVLCNGILTFYTLPELSPAYPNTKPLSNCSWIGGRDLNLDEHAGPDAEVLMICVKNRIRLVRIGEDLRLVKNIEYPGCLASVRRGRFACVADAHSYALLDVDNQQKIPLFPISSIDENAPSANDSRVQSISPPSGPRASRSASSTHARSEIGMGEASHSRTTSLGTFVGGFGRRQPVSRSRSRDRSGLMSPEGVPGKRSPLQSTSPIRPASSNQSPTREPQAPEQKPLPNIPSSAFAPRTSSQPIPALLRPQICSPVPTEFLLITGTSADDPGVGIFVNCDGDVVRGTLEFSKYPNAVIVDGGDPTNLVAPEDNDQDGYVLAVIPENRIGLQNSGLEIQRWDIDSGEGKTWLALPRTTADDESGDQIYRKSVGLGVTQTATQLNFSEVGERLRSRRLRIFDGFDDEGSSDAKMQSMQKDSQLTLAQPTLDDSERTRNQQEDEYARRLGQRSTRVVSWSASSIFWVVRNPLILRLDGVIDQVLQASSESRLDQGKLIKIIRTIRNQEAKTETEFFSLGYIRQKIGVILFADLASNRFDVNHHINEQLFIEGNLDPRVILSMVPLLRRDIVEGPKGIWIHAGLVTLIQRQLSALPITLDADEVLSRPEEFDLLGLTKRYLSIWRQRKGFGSIADEAQVFSTVDAALLHILLYQDQQATTGPGGSSTIRAELYAVVDHGVDCFDRAVELLEEYRRLYVLSRLYQSRKMAAKVLSTWRRIIKGDPDEGGELMDGENEVRKYLVKIKDSAMFEEYGTWLARRNPALGVQVFTDDNSRVKLPPSQVVQVLRLRAPDAVKVYLEHLVFGKKNVQYANELISYYLDNVLTILESSSDARSTLAQSYESYRALHPPKPTYRQFITDNAIPAPWWHDRLRLLELLGGSHGAGFSYNVAKVLERIEPFEDALVPESIILDGRQGRHHQALRLLTHGLGDYHTAINYCLLGGSSIFHPISGTVKAESVPSQDEQATLFRWLLSEFLQIEDASDRVERTSELLERFGSWFDVAYVLGQIPDSWSVELVSAFLVSAFRRLVQDRSEAVMCKALSGAENLRISADFVEKCEKLGPRKETG